MRHWKLTVLVVLLALNITLFFLWNRQVKEQEGIHSLLASRDAIESYVQDQEGYVHNLSDELTYRKQATSIIQDAASLQQAVLEIQSQTIPYEKVSTGDYFKSTLSIHDTQQKELWGRYQHYVASLNTILEEFIPAKRKALDSLYTSLQQQFKKDEEKLLTRSFVYNQDGTARVSLTIKHSSRTFELQGHKRKDENFIRWRTDAPWFAFLRNMESRLNSSKSLQARKQLNKFETIFISEGKLMLYGNVISLSKLSPAELQSVCKYIQMTKVQTEITFRDAVQELYNF